MEDILSIISNNKNRLSFLAFFLDNMDFKITNQVINLLYLVLLNKI